MREDLTFFFFFFKGIVQKNIKHKNKIKKGIQKENNDTKREKTLFFEFFLKKKNFVSENKNFKGKRLEFFVEVFFLFYF